MRFTAFESLKDSQWKTAGSSEPSFWLASSSDEHSPTTGPILSSIFTDDHAPHAIGAYNGWLKSVNPTPNIDRLAADGMLFQNSFCYQQHLWSQSSRHPNGQAQPSERIRPKRQLFDGDQQTFPKLLQQAGYTTAMIGKWHLATTPQGYDYWKVLPGQGFYYNPKVRHTDGDEVIEGYCTDIVTDLSLDWLNEVSSGDKPFMLMCQHKAPHRNWMPALRHLHLYDDVDIPETCDTVRPLARQRRVAQVQKMEIDRDLGP